MKISILTICPEQFKSFLKTPLIERNIKTSLLQMEIIDIRINSYTTGLAPAADGCLIKKYNP